MAKNELNTMSAKNLQHVTAQQRILGAFAKTGVYLFLGVMALIVLFPFYWMIISSLKTTTEYRQAIPTFWPHDIQWMNYVNAFNTANLGKLFLNTLYVGVVSTVLSLIVTVLSAFAFARLEFKGKNALFAALLTDKDVQYTPAIPLSDLENQVRDAEGTLPQSMLPIGLLKITDFSELERLVR